jgi:RNA polymerase sigma-70 factor (ECF subfamily)
MRFEYGLISPRWRATHPGRTILDEPSTKAGPGASMEHMERPSSLTPDVSAEATTAALTFEDLFVDQHERLYRALYLIVGDTHEAEELMQDAFLHVLERWDRIDDPAGYLYRSALNSTRSRFRRLKVAAKRDLTPGQPEDPFAAADLRDQMVRGLRELPERQRAALVLLDLLDYRSEDAADVLRVTPATVRSLASHGRAALKLSLEAEDDG